MSERSGVGIPALPAGWEWVRLGQLVESIDTGKSFTADGTPPDRNQVGVMKVSAVTWGTYDEIQSKTVHDPSQVNPKFFVQPGDFLFSRANTIELVGAVVLVDRVTRNVMLSDKILRFRMPLGLKRWTLWALRSQLGRQQIKLLATGNQESMRNIGQDRIRQIVLPLPPPLDRDRIISAIEAHISRLDAAVASLHRAKTNLKHARASVLKAAVEGRLVPTEAALAHAEGRDYEPASTLLAHILTERRARWAKTGVKNKYKEPVGLLNDSLTDLPVGWARASLDSFLAEPLRNGKSAKTNDREGGIRILTLSAVTTGLFIDDNTKLTVATPAQVEDLWLEPGDILIQRSNTPDLVGTSAMYKGPSNWAVFPDLLIRVRCTARISAQWVALVLRAPPARAYFRKHAKGIAGSMPKIDQGTVAATPILVPPLAEQHRIVAEVDRRISVLDALDATLDANLIRCTLLRQSILKCAFEGELVRPDASTPVVVQLPHFTEEAAP